ncbi:MAG TPA: kynureninase [Thermoanaerobaculia bacterium]|jgi:kynureninase
MTLTDSPPDVFHLSREAAAERDRVDPLASCRDLFLLPADVLYFDGNSLGPLTRAARERVREVTERQWGEDLVRSWNLHGWIDLPRRVAAKIAPLVGAAADEIAVTDSTSVNLFKLLAAALALRPERRVILSETAQFPTDLYMIQGLAELLDGRCEPRLVEPEGLLEALDDDVAAVCLSHVRYKDSTLLDMAAVNRAARGRGALTVWDLSHSAGALAVDLEGCGADFAVGCGYKFLNGGPGAPAFVYVARRHQEAARTPLAGWLGHEDPFLFDLDYRPAPGVERFLCGTPPVIALAALDAALDAFAGVDLAALRAKSVALGDLFLELLRRRCPQVGIACPEDGRRRGSHLALSHPEGYAVVQALVARGVVCDFRPPDVMRFGLAPLYLRYADVWDAAAALADVLETRAWDDPRFRRRGKVI